jgi:hypothetical protein
MLIVKPIFFEFEPVKIANATANGALLIAVSRSIVFYEKQCFDLLFGSVLSKEIVESFELISGTSSYTLKPSATIPIKNLVNGFDYSVVENGVTIAKSWKGFIEEDKILVGVTETNFKKSFLTDYIYVQHKLENISASTGTGQQILQGENSIPTTSVLNRMMANDRFVFSVLGGNGKTGLYEFMNDNIADYPTLVKTCGLKFSRW